MVCLQILMVNLIQTYSKYFHMVILGGISKCHAHPNVSHYRNLPLIYNYVYIYIYIDTYVYMHAHTHVYI